MEFNKVNRKLIRGGIGWVEYFIEIFNYIFLCRYFNIFIYYYPNGMRIINKIIILLVRRTNIYFLRRSLKKYNYLRRSLK